MKPRIGIVGEGNVGSALRRGLERAGYEVRSVGKDPGQVKETGNWADVVILAVPYGAVDDAVAELGDGIEGKTLVDVTNALTGDMRLANGCTSGHGIFGISNLEWPSVFSTVAFMAAGIVTTNVVYRVIFHL